MGRRPGVTERAIRPAVAFSVPGEPVPKARPRVTSHGTFTPASTTKAQAAIGWAYRKAGGRGVLADAVFLVEMVFMVSLTRAGERRKVDVDNLAKLVLDGLNGVAWVDDNQVLQIIATKRYVPALSDACTAVRVVPYQSNGPAPPPRLQAADLPPPRP